MQAQMACATAPQGLTKKQSVAGRLDRAAQHSQTS
jgi:hypothetical protein